MSKKYKLDSFKKNEGFKVPENYFDGLEAKIMDAMPKPSQKSYPLPDEKTTLWVKLKPIMYLAAMFIGAALIIKVALPTLLKEQGTIAQGIDLDEVSDEFIQETVDGALFDDYAMYVYLSENIESYEE